MERSAGSLGAIPYVIETPDCSTAGVNPTIRIEYRPQLDLLEIVDGANRLRAYQATDRQRRPRATPGGRNSVQHLLEDPDVAVALEIGIAHVRTPVTNANFVCRLQLEHKKYTPIISHIK